MPFIQQSKASLSPGSEDTQPLPSCRFWIITDTGPSPGAPGIGTLTADTTLNLDNRSCLRVQSTTLHFLVKGSSSYKLVEGYRCTFSHSKNYMTLTQAPWQAAIEFWKLVEPRFWKSLQTGIRDQDHIGKDPDRHLCWHSSSYWVTHSLQVMSPAHNARNPHFTHRNLAQHHHGTQLEVLPSYKCERLSPVP